MSRSFQRASNKSTASKTSLFDGMTDLETVPDIHFFDELSSTMDEAKRMVTEQRPAEMFSIVTMRQTNGRGTRGRIWKSVDGNLFMTLSVPLKDIKIPLHLCPLRLYPLSNQSSYDN
jgi:hypothetical protein